MESLVWASDKVDNESQGIYNPFTSGSPHSPGCNDSARLADCPCAPVAYGLGHPRSLKVLKKIEPPKSAKKINNWALNWWKKKSCPESQRKKKLCPNFYIRPPPEYLMVNGLLHKYKAHIKGFPIWHHVTDNNFVTLWLHLKGNAEISSSCAST